MRPALALAVAAAAAITILGCAETEEAPQSDTPPPTTPAASMPDPTAESTPEPTTEAEPTGGRTLAPTPTGGITLSSYDDSQYGFSLSFPTGWTMSEQPISQEQAEFDLLKRVEFTAKDDLPRVTVTVGNNPEALPLGEWIREHDPIFFDTPPEEIILDGHAGLLQPTPLGLPSPHAYVDAGSFILSINVLAAQDWDLVAPTVRFEDHP